MKILLVFVAFFCFPIGTIVDRCHARRAGASDQLPVWYKSPLDEEPGVLDEAESDGGGVFGLLSGGGGGGGQFPLEIFGDEFAKVTLHCQQKCAQKFSDMVQMAIKSPTHFERFENVCERYNETIRCMDQGAGYCPNQEPFNVFTSGLYYMCIEQRKAFEAVIDCIDAQAQEVQIECDEQCHTRGKITNWAVNSGLLDNFIGSMVVRASNGVAGFARASDGQQQRMNPQFLRKMMQDGCELLQCSLSCVRVKFNTRCQKNAGSLLSEALVRPMAETQKVLGFDNFKHVMNMFVPRQCDFITNSDVLSQFRIDPQLDQSIKRTFEKVGGEDLLGGGEDAAGEIVADDEPPRQPDAEEMEVEGETVDEGEAADNEPSVSGDQPAQSPLNFSEEADFSAAHPNPEDVASVAQAQPDLEDNGLEESSPPVQPQPVQSFASMPDADVIRSIGVKMMNERRRNRADFPTTQDEWEYRPFGVRS